jgi:hypothetical protein
VIVGPRFCRCWLFFERVLETVLCDNRRTSPHLHIRWVVFWLGFLRGYRVFPFFLSGLCLRDFAIYSDRVRLCWCLVLYCADYFGLLLFGMNIISLVILFIKSFVHTSQCNIYGRTVTLVLFYLFRGVTGWRLEVDWVWSFRRYEGMCFGEERIEEIPIFKIMGTNYGRNYVGYDFGVLL